MNERRDEDPFAIDPELRELLKEIARKQEARLLRVPDGDAAQDAIGAEELARPTMPGLAAVERTLLLHYREEVAALLGQLALARLHQRESVRRVARLYVSPGERLIVPSERSVRRRLASERSRVQEDYGTEPTALELLDAIQRGARRRASAAMAARAALRLIPGDAARLYLARDLFDSGSPLAALRGFEHVYENSHLVSMRAAALSWQAVPAMREGDFLRAFRLNQRAREFGTERPNHTFNCFVYALQAGLRQEALAEAVHVDGMADDRAPALNEWLVGAYEQRMNAEWHPTPEGRELSTTLIDRFGPAARRIAHVLR